MSNVDSIGRANRQVEIKDIARKSVETALSLGSTLLIGLLTGIAISRGLGPSQKGVFVGLTTWVTVLIWVFNLSFYQVTVYFYQKHIEKRGALFSTFVIISFSFGVVATVVAELVLCPVLVQHYHLDSPLALRFLLATIPTSTMFQVASGALNGMMMFRFTNIMRLLMSVATLAAWLFLLVVRDMNVDSCIIWTCIINVSCNTISLIVAALKTPTLGPPDFAFVRTSLVYGLKTHGGTMADVANSNLTPVVLAVALPPTYLGYFSTAQSAAAVLSVFSGALAFTGFPLLSSLDQRHSVHLTAMRMWRILLVVTIPGGLLLSCAIPWLLPLVYSNRYSAAIPSAIILMVTGIVAGQAGILRSALNACGYALVSSTSEGVSLVFALGSMLVLPRYFGVDGAALATVVGAMTRTIVLFVSYTRNIGRPSLVEMVPSQDDLNWCISTLTNQVLRVIPFTRGA